MAFYFRILNFCALIVYNIYVFVLKNAHCSIIATLRNWWFLELSRPGVTVLTSDRVHIYSTFRPTIIAEIFKQTILNLFHSITSQLYITDVSCKILALRSVGWRLRRHLYRFTCQSYQGLEKFAEFNSIIACFIMKSINPN